MHKIYFLALAFFFLPVFAHADSITLNPQFGDGTNVEVTCDFPDTSGGNGRLHIFNMQGFYVYYTGENCGDTPDTFDIFTNFNGRGSGSAFDGLPDGQYAVLFNQVNFDDCIDGSTLESCMSAAGLGPEYVAYYCKNVSYPCGDTPPPTPTPEPPFSGCGDSCEHSFPIASTTAFVDNPSLNIFLALLMYIVSFGFTVWLLNFRRE